MVAVLHFNGRIRQKLWSCIKQDLMEDEIWLLSDIADKKTPRFFAE